MRELYVVAVSEDGRHVVLAGSKDAVKGTHRVRLDARLVSAVRGELPGAEPAVELTPKDIQARLRAGESAEQIARSAGVPVTRVERFGGPVAAEMARVVAAAQEAFVVRGRRGPSTLALGPAVAAAVDQPVSWSARREDDGRWRVSIRWQARGRDREAAWLFAQGSTELAPVDPASAALGHVEAAPPRRTTKPAPKAAKPAPKPARPRTRPAPEEAAAVATPAAPKAPARKATGGKPAAPKQPRAVARPRLRVVPDSAPSATPADERDGVRARASVPAWEDVLLGTTPGGER